MNALKITSIRTEHLLLAILITAAVLRLLFLADHSYWVDELWSIKFASLNLLELVSEIAAIDVHPPLYYALLHFWMQTFGDSEFAVRSLSVVGTVKLKRNAWNRPRHAGSASRSRPHILWSRSADFR